nr:MAG TPA: Minor capsid component [Caudoviricetes sp.]
MPTAIKDFKIKESYSKLIEKALFSYFWDCIYKPLFEIMAIKPPKAQNEFNPLVEALKAGNIYYVKDEGGFKAKVKFTNQQSRILENWGAVYDKWTKVYKIPFDKIPQSMLVAISENQTLAMQKVETVKTFLQEVEGNLDFMIDGMVFNKEVISILDDAGNEVSKNIKHLNVIEPELSEEQKQEIAENYVNNVKGYAIKFFGNERIPTMRQKIAEAVLNGYRADTVQKMLETEYGILGRKAKFWARNETALMLAEYKKTTYQEMGFDKFIWKTILDGRERDRHKHLNNKIFSYDNPPVIDDNGNVGLPGQTYNCRCQAIPYSDDNPFIKTRTDKNGQKIAINAKDDVEWITVKGNHIPIKDGQTKEQAVKEFLEKKGKQSKTNNSKPIAGIKKGKPMFFKQANGGKVNPKYTGKRDGYSGNCQTCVAVFEARLRGYDMQAIPYTPLNPYMEALGHKPTFAYIDKKNNRIPDMLYSDIKRPSECEEWLKDRVKQGQRFAFIFKPMYSSNGHIIEVSKNILGQLKFYDPQSGKHFNKDLLKEINYRPENNGDTPLIFRVDDKELNTDFLNRMYKYSRENKLD